MTSTPTTISPQRLALLMTAIRDKKAATPTIGAATGKRGELITYNTEQQQFIDLVSKSHANAVLIGAAGTGKTTCMQGACVALIQSSATPIMDEAATATHRYLQAGTPGIVACSFTRRAVVNLRKAMPAGMQHNCITIHKLLEFAPVYYDVLDEATQEYKTTMRFEPTRNALNPLPAQITTIIVDESSMVSVELYKQLVSALPHKVQWIFLGDIHQLPPVFGSAILGFKMLELRTVELISVYRQAMESPIILYATKIKNGETFQVNSKIESESSSGKITFRPWIKKISSDLACLTFCKFICDAIDATDAGYYNPETDMILCPYNKAFGTIEINKAIASHLAKKNFRPVWEIVAGFTKIYLSVGDRVLYDKEDAIVTEISRNAQYHGNMPQDESVTLDYWGHNNSAKKYKSVQIDEIDSLLDSISAEPIDKVRLASHIVTISMLDSEQTVVLDTAADINSLLLSYALTIHKAQGSEWDKVFLVLHQSHATMVQRELLYTAVTRAAKELYVICEKETFVSGVASQKVKGTTLKEKAEYFKGKLDARGGY